MAGARLDGAGEGLAEGAGVVGMGELAAPTLTAYFTISPEEGASWTLDGESVHRPVAATASRSRVAGIAAARGARAQRSAREYGSGAAEIDGTADD